jgi:hypothetical protein
MPLRQTLDKHVRRARLSNDFSGIGFEDEPLAGGCPAIEAEAQHYRI